MRNILINKKNKKAQLDSIFYFFVVAFVILMIAPLMLKIPTTFFEKLQPIAGNQSDASGANITYIDTKLKMLWDEMIVLFFLGNCLLLFVTAFLIDVHPAFLILYIIGLGLLFIVAMPVWDAVNQMWANSQLTDQVALMPLSKFLVDNFPIVLLGVVVISGIIMYAKFKFGGNQSVY